MDTHLPTCTTGLWTVTSLRDSLLSELNSDKSSLRLAIFFYAVTTRGWSEIRREVLAWKKAQGERCIVAYIGTDHGMTEPAALGVMQSDGVDVHIVSEYQGIFHPKVMWLTGGLPNLIWIGSNNLTRDGLLNNVEFAVLINSDAVPPQLEQWAQAIHAASQPLTSELLQSYEKERAAFERKLAGAGATTFVWSRKKEPSSKRAAIPSKKGQLIVEIMPKETGLDGKQIQFPREAATAFFGARRVGDSIHLRLRSSGS